MSCLSSQVVIYYIRSTWQAKLTFSFTQSEQWISPIVLSPKGVTGFKSTQTMTANGADSTHPNMKAEIEGLFSLSLIFQPQVLKVDIKETAWWRILEFHSNFKTIKAEFLTRVFRNNVRTIVSHTLNLMGQSSYY